MKDSFGREIDYMRVSVTERCNLRCRYCRSPFDTDMPIHEAGQNRPFRTTDHESTGDPLSCDEILRIIRITTKLGIRHIRLTGGEPLLREGIEGLIRSIRSINGIETVTMTTNGILLEEKLPELVREGLAGVNVSLDTTDEEKYCRITGVSSDEGKKYIGTIFRGIDAALAAGLRVGINCVLNRGPGSDDIADWRGLAEIARDRKVSVRFIEIMPIGCGKNYKGVPNTELMEMMREQYPGMKPERNPETAAGSSDAQKPGGNGPAVYYIIPGFEGSIGFISAISDRFCSRCNRIRLTSRGGLKPCLCYGEQTELSGLLRSGADDDTILHTIEKTILSKPLEHHFEAPEMITEKREMSGIGG